MNPLPPAELGAPLPDSPHAVSVSLPHWQDNVGYEEADPAVTSRMQLGYPRFFVHPLVRKLFEQAAESAASAESCLAFPSRKVAERCARYVAQHESVTARVFELNASGFSAVAVPESAVKTAHSFWQHSGEIVSSRAAQLWLDGQTPSISETPAKHNIRHRLASLAGVAPHDVFLFPTGMAAIFAIWRVLQSLRPGRRSAQFGFPYVDTLKIQQRFPSTPDSVAFYPRGDAGDLLELQQLLADEAIMGLFCEFPCNPLLVSPDLSRLSALSAEHDFPLIVDDTLGAQVNVDVLPAADVTVTSLTKYFSGYGDVMGGALILNENRPRYESIRERLVEEFEDLFFDADADVLEKNSRDMESRMETTNRNAEELCDFLQSHPAVNRVYFPKFVTPAEYSAFRRAEGGYGGLFSLLLHNPATATPAVFDRLAVSKGPNLGTRFTLASPYVLLAHYDELDFVERCGISRYLIRVAVGTEEVAWLKSIFADALNAAVQ